MSNVSHSESSTCLLSKFTQKFFTSYIDIRLNCRYVVHIHAREKSTSPSCILWTPNASNNTHFLHLCLFICGMKSPSPKLGLILDFIELCRYIFPRWIAPILVYATCKNSPRLPLLDGLSICMGPYNTCVQMVNINNGIEELTRLLILTLV